MSYFWLIPLGKSPWKSLPLRWNTPFCSHPQLPGERGHFWERHRRFRRTRFLWPRWCGRCPCACTCTWPSPPAGKWGRRPRQQSLLEERDHFNVSPGKTREVPHSQTPWLELLGGEKPMCHTGFACCSGQNENTLQKSKMGYPYCRNAGKILTSFLSNQRFDLVEHIGAKSSLQNEK